MTDRKTLGQDQPAAYRIQVQGRLSQRWADWFEGLAVTHPDPMVTTLTGVVTDQAALLGILQRLYTLGLPLLLVERRPEADPDAADRHRST
jgi:hypothetical protein